MTKNGNALRDQRQVEFGDWQTPLPLAEAVLSVIRQARPCFGAVLEPTCGQGSFLRAAAAAYPHARLSGYDISASYVQATREQLDGHNVDIQVADFFQMNWEKTLEQLPEPILIVGNPPWVTNSALGTFEAGNLPKKSNFKGYAGLDAMTGKSNFDISEWMLLRLLEAAVARDFTMAMLCKASVARRVMEWVASQRRPVEGEVRTIDARSHFSAAVDAVLLTVRKHAACHVNGGLRWAVYPTLGASAPTRHMGVVDGKTCSDLEAFLATRSLEGLSEIEWRSGIKHDCARIMELEIGKNCLINGLGEAVELEHEYLYPLLKGSDLANGRASARRRVIVTQRQLGEDTSRIRERAPATWRYLAEHRQYFDARKSSIYRDQPAFALFGVGDYSFTPYKVAICGLYKKLAFTVVRPIDNRPVMVDDTAYFLPCGSAEEAEDLARALNSGVAAKFFQARVFWDAKRPISKALLQSLSLEALLKLQGYTPPAVMARPQQQSLVL